jgi:hypothetical protein
MTEIWKVGERVRLAIDIAPYPLGAFPRGATGTIVEVTPDAREGDPVALVRLDEHFEDLDDWENCLQVFRERDSRSEIIESIWERIDG